MKSILITIIATILLFSCNKKEVKKELKHVSLYDNNDIKEASIEFNYEENAVKKLIIKDFQHKIDSLLLEEQTDFNVYATYQLLSNMQNLANETDLDNNEISDINLWAKNANFNNVNNYVHVLCHKTTHSK